ncbi:MAG: hypothetical protein AB1331_03375 [Bacillota bacterium]
MGFLRQLAGSRRPLIVAVAPACLGALDLPAPAALAWWLKELAADLVQETAAQLPTLWPERHQLWQQEPGLHLTSCPAVVTRVAKRGAPILASPC